MGRPPLSKELAQETTIRLIQVAQELILSEGLEQVTIRKIAARAGLNSAILYKYFNDLDDLLLFACVDIIKAYTNDLAAAAARSEIADPHKAYFISWRLFCDHGFRHPDCFHHLFFSRYSHRLQDVIRRYYQLFPQQLEGVTGSLQSMLREADLSRRNLEVLRPLIQDRVSEEQLHILNDLTVAYFQTLLIEKINAGDRIDAQQLTRRMLSAAELLTILPA